jgi:hypothetical protein
MHNAGISFLVKRVTETNAEEFRASVDIGG